MGGGWDQSEGGSGGEREDGRGGAWYREQGGGGVRLTERKRKERGRRKMEWERE